MSVVKYKLLKHSNGIMTIPPYISNGGHFSNQESYTMYGWLDKKKSIEFNFNKNDVTEVTKSEFISELLQNHATLAFTKNDGENEVEMTIQEVIDMATNWYDSFILENSEIPENPTENDILNLQENIIVNAFSFMTKILENSHVEIPINSQNATRPFGCDFITQQNIIGIITAITSGIPVPNPTNWTPKGYPYPVEVTHDELKLIGASILNKKNMYYAVYFNHKSNILMTNNILELLTYDYSTGYNI